MILGIQKQQLLLLFVILIIPILLNSAGVWEYVGTDSIIKMWSGTYPHPLLGFLGGPYNPLPKILLTLLLTAVPLGLITWLLMFIANKPSFQKQTVIAKFFEVAVMSSLIAVIFAAVTGIFMPLVWLPIFRNSPTLGGMPGSDFMLKWSLWLVLPATAIILFLTAFIFKKTNTPSMPS